MEETKDEKIRAAFEVWGTGYDFTRRADGVYVNTNTRYAWRRFESIYLFLADTAGYERGIRDAANHVESLPYINALPFAESIRGLIGGEDDGKE